MKEEIFINRFSDFDKLDDLWGKKGARFLVLYGRRRVGKTALIAKFASEKQLLHWIAYRTSSTEQLNDFSRQVYSYLNDGEGPEDNFSYGSWKNAFEAIAAFARDKDIGIFIDEFPYLVEADPSIPSLLQSVWDSKLSKGRIFFGLSGSRIGMMKDEILDPRGPLYGRATSVLYLQPIDIFNMAHFFPRYGPVQLIEAFGITGGVPKYFEFISDSKPVLKNVEEAVKSGTTLLTAEADLLLNEEFRETRIYISILRALGLRMGSLELKGLSSACGVESKSLSKYLDQLIELKFVKRKVSAGVDPAQSRKSLYYICDQFLAFYFRFIAPHLQNIEKGLTNDVVGDVHDNFDAYIGKRVFEEICREWLFIAADERKLSFVPDSIGEYWDREMQVDVYSVSRHDQMMLVGESKWSNKKVGAEVLQDLEMRAKKLNKKNDYYYQLALFSRAGFTPQLLDIAAKRNILLVTLKDMFERRQ